MPAYDYECPYCGKVEERTVTQDNKDKQYCDCDCGSDIPAKMERLCHYGSLVIDIPYAHRAVNDMPLSAIKFTDGAEKKWKELGVTHPKDL